VATPAEVPGSNDFGHLDWLTQPKPDIETKELIAGLANAPPITKSQKCNFEPAPPDPGVARAYEDCIHWLRTVHSKSKWTVVAIEKIYSELKRRKITPAQARERIKSENLDLTGGAP
jgi:hypothetical protein